MMTPLAWSSLLTHNHFRQFTKKEIADANKVTEVLIAISAESREHVDSLIDRAIEHGATTYAEPADYGFCINAHLQS
jgi:predicted lactoylglutathione lyase